MYSISCIANLKMIIKNMFKEINPLLGDIDPSFFHIHSVKTNNVDMIETVFVFCLASTTPILIEFFEYNSSIYKKNVTPNKLYNEKLCITGQLKTNHKDNITVILYDFNNKEVLKFFSDGGTSLNKTNIKVISSDEPYKQFYFKKPVRNDYPILINRIYNKVYLKFRFTYLRLKRLAKVTIKTLLDIIKYIFTSKLR